MFENVSIKTPRNRNDICCKEKRIIEKHRLLVVLCSLWNNLTIFIDNEKNRQRQNIIEWRNRGKKISKHQRKLNVPDFEGKIVKKRTDRYWKKATCWRNDGEKANRSNDEMKEKKIILNYLCVTLVYDAYGIRGQLCVWKSVHNVFGRIVFQCVQNIKYRPIDSVPFIFFLTPCTV